MLKPIHFAFSLMLALAVAGPLSAEPDPPNPKVPEPYPGWMLVWSDEFAGPDGSAPDPAHWSCAIGGGGYGNHELETYTSRPENVVVQSGELVITCRRETLTGPDGIERGYTSARLKSEGHFDQRFGRFEARIKIPGGQGVWPAFWMLGSDHGTAGWPGCGEIDIMENVGKEPGLVHGTVHGPGYSGAHGISGSYTLPEGHAFWEDYHVYGVDWSPGRLVFEVDGKAYHTVTPDRLPKEARWVFDHPFYLLLNLAVGGDWPGPPDENTPFPQQMRVDWVRVYTKPTP